MRRALTSAQEETQRTRGLRYSSWARHVRHRTRLWFRRKLRVRWHRWSTMHPAPRHLIIPRTSQGARVTVVRQLLCMMCVPGPSAKISGGSGRSACRRPSCEFYGDLHLCAFCVSASALFQLRTKEKSTERAEQCVYIGTSERAGSMYVYIKFNETYKDRVMELSDKRMSKHFF